MSTKLNFNPDSIKIRVQGGMQAALVACAQEAKFKVIGHLHEPKTGVQYPRLPARSSAPGEAPATQSEVLERSIKAQLTSKDSAATFSEDPKAPYLEHGTAHVAPRPVWSVVAEEMKGRDVEEIMEREMKKALG